MPDPDYPKKLARSVQKKLSQDSSAKNRKKIWIASTAGIAAVIIIVFMLNFILPFNKADIVYAMEEAFQDIDAYHGLIEVVQTNAEGKSFLQSKLEVWANKEGQYYIKGLEGPMENLVTVNNGEQKWQLRPDSKEVYIFPAFPDPYTFTFELGNEIEEAKNALSTKIIGEDTIAGRETYIVEVTPDGGTPYKIWINEETNLPLQKQYGIHNALQYTITYTQIEFSNSIPEELITYHIPEGFKEINTNPEQLVNNIEEAQEILGFNVQIPENLPNGYVLDSIAVVSNAKLLKVYYTAESNNGDAKVVVIQGQSANELKPASTAILGKIGDSIAEIQAPIHEDLGVLGGSGAYAGLTDITSIRWQKDGFEYAVVSNASLENLTAFVKSLTGNQVEIPSSPKEESNKPKVEVPVDLAVEENTQKSVDGGSSPWRLDPTFVAQVFVSLEMSPEGITGEYPIALEDLTVVENTGTEAIVEVSGNNTPIKRVYLKRLVRQDSTGIWTVVGYDPAE